VVLFEKAVFDGLLKKFVEGCVLFEASFIGIVASSRHHRVFMLIWLIGFPEMYG